MRHWSKAQKANGYGRLLGITLQPQMLTKYFLNAPYMSRLSAECYACQGASGTNKAKHHQLNQRTSTRQMKYCKALTESFKNFTVPFECDDEYLINLVITRVYSNVICNDVCRMSAIGEKHHADFVQKRLI